MALIEFKNLPDTSTPLSAENLNHNFNELSNRDARSTEEQVIGTWLGKPLYRKVISVDTHMNKKLEFGHGVENFEKIWIDVSNSYIFDNTNKISFPLISTSYYEDFSQRFSAMIYNNVIVLNSDGVWNTNWTKVITLNYTKTTD